MKLKEIAKRFLAISAVIAIISIILFSADTAPTSGINNFDTYKQAQDYLKSLNSSSAIPPKLIPVTNGNGAIVITGNSSNPISSSNTPLQNIADSAGLSPQVKLGATLTKIGSDPTQISTDTSTTLVPLQQAFIVQQGQTTDYTTGELDIAFKIQADSSIKVIDGTFVLDTTINGMHLNSNGVSVVISSYGQPSGQPTVKLATPIGVLDKYTLPISTAKQNFVSGINTIKFNISNVKITADGKTYGLTNSTAIFTISIENDPNQVLVKNDAGQIIKTYPVDDRLSISSLNQYVQSRTCAGNGAGTFAICGQVSQAGPITTSIGTINISQNGQSIASTYDNLAIFLQRNSTYVISVPSQGANFVIQTPLNQQNYDYTCQAWTITTTHQTKANYLYYNVVPAPITCTFPKQ